MKYAMLYKMAQMAYRGFLRELLLKSIDDPDTEWDDLVLSITDKLFDYEA